MHLPGARLTVLVLVGLVAAVASLATLRSPRGVTRAEHPAVSPALERLWLVLPIVFLVVLVALAARALA